MTIAFNMALFVAVIDVELVLIERTFAFFVWCSYIKVSCQVRASFLYTCKISISFEESSACIKCMVVKV
jgi:hypothetical protein